MRCCVTMLSLSVVTLVVLATIAPRCDVEQSNVLVLVSDCEGDDCVTTTIDSSTLPKLPEATEHFSTELIDTCKFNGTVVIGQPLSVRESNAYYSYSTEMRRSVEICIDLVNQKRGGVRVGGKQLALHYHTVGDGSSMEQVTNATSRASRASRGSDAAHILLGPFGSSLTKYAVKQAHAEGKIMMATSSATPAVVGDNNLTFGTLPETSKSVYATTRAVIAAAELCDAPDDSTDVEVTAYKADNLMCSLANREQLCAAGGGSCRQSLRAGFIYQDATFTETMCVQNGQRVLDSLDVAYATNATTGSALTLAIPAAPACKDGVDACPEYNEVIEQVHEALDALWAAGVTYIVGCTYFGTAEMVINALYNMSYSPLALMVTAAISDPAYAPKVVAIDQQSFGWWQGRYVLEPVSWYAPSPKAC